MWLAYTLSLATAPRGWSTNEDLPAPVVFVADGLTATKLSNVKPATTGTGKGSVCQDVVVTKEKS